jgi:hypothetical protein
MQLTAEEKQSKLKDAARTRKYIVKVVLSPPQKTILDELSKRLDISESEAMRTALMDYAKPLGLIKEVVHQKKFLLKTKK